METKAFGIQSPESLAKEYGGNKQKIAKAVQLGILDPTAAVLAGMFIDRVRNAAQEEQGPQTTVAQQVLGGQPPAPPQGPPQAGLQAATPPPMRMAYGGQVGVSNNQLPAPAMERGLDGIPIPDNMFDYADGGMVAFGSGGDVQRFAPGGLASERIAARQVSPFPSSSIADLFSRQQSLIPPYMFDDEVNYRRMLQNMSAEDLKDLARKTPMTVPGTGETNPRFKAIEETLRSRATAAAPYTAPPMQGAGAPPNPYGTQSTGASAYKAPPIQGAAVPPNPFETKLERMYRQTSGVVGNALKSLGPAAGIAGASMAVEQATGLTPEEQMLRGIGAGNPILGGITAALKRFELTTPKEAKGSPLVEGRPRGQANEDTTFVPPPQPPAPPSQENLRKQEDARVNAAVSEARKLIGDVPRLQAPKAPDRLVVPERADLAMEMETARQIAGSMYAMPADADKTRDQILKSDRETLAKQGYDFDLIKNMVAETRAEREKIPAQRKEAANLRLLEAGLAIMGGTSPFAFVNIGKGASEAAKGFNEDMKEFRKLDREYRKELQQLQSMQNQETFMLTTEGNRKYERIQDRVEQTKDKRANAMYQIGQNMVNQVSKDRETAQTLNSAIDRTVYQTQAELAKAEAQMRNQTGIALAQIAGQERIAARPAAEVQAVREYANDPAYARAYRQMQADRYAPRAEADLREEYTKNIMFLKQQFPTFEDYKKYMMQSGEGQTKPAGSRAPLSTFGS